MPERGDPRLFLFITGHKLCPMRGVLPNAVVTYPGKESVIVVGDVPYTKPRSSKKLSLYESVVL